MKRDDPPLLRCLRGIPPAKGFRFSKTPGKGRAEINDNKQGVKEMADQTKSPTQDAAASVANRVTSGSSNTTTANQATVARVSETGNQQPTNLNLQLPDALKGGGQKMSEPYVTEDHGTWRLLSDGSVILPGGSLWDKYSAQHQQPPPREVERKPLALTMIRSDWEKLDHDERWRRVGEGVVVREDNWQEQEAKAAHVKMELAQWRKDHAPPQMKLKDFNAMSQPERNEYIKSGGTVVD